MRQSSCGQTRTSVLAFGCGSVLGRIGRAASLRAMHTAWDQGITFFDTARNYGYGEAESVLGEFLRGKREQAVIATKFGLSPRRLSRLQRIAVPAVRTALRVPGVRSLVHRNETRHNAGTRHTALGQFTVAGLRKSLETSLRQLCTDHVDVLFLHEATAAAIHQQDVMAELDAVMQEGKVLRVGLYAATDVIADALANGPATLGAMQFGANAFDPAVAAFSLHGGRNLLMVANHPFGGAQRVARFQAILTEMAEDVSVPLELRDKLRQRDWQVIVEAIFGTILAPIQQGTGVHALVLSMMQPDHVRANARAVESSRFARADLALIRARMLSAAAQTQARGSSADWAADRAPDRAAS